MTSYEERLEAFFSSDPEKAASYLELLALWKALRAREDPDTGELAEWDQLVLTLLTIDERGYYLDVRRLAGGTVAAGKVNRLAGILLGRHNPPAGIAHKRAGSLREEPGTESAPQDEVAVDRRPP